jgi:hypothetical protein
MFLNDLRRGETLAEFAEAVETLVRAVQETSKAGTISLSITVKPMGGNKVSVADKIRSSLPEATHEDTIFFVTEDGVLSRQNPRQLSMEDLKNAR